MRVVLIAPVPASYIWRKKRAAFTLPPIALPLLAAVTPPGVEVRLIDEAVQDVDLNLGPIGFLNMGTVTLVAGANIPPFPGIAKTKAGD